MNSPRCNPEYFGDLMEQKDRSHCFSDLELAAEIGKNLLERNKELEILLKSSHEYLEEQSVKNEFLSKQLDALRDVHENQVRACEQMESTAQELQKTNKELQSETTVMKKRYQTLVQAVDTLESKCEDYRVEVEELRVERMRLQRQMASALSLKLTEKESGYEIISGDESEDTEKAEKALEFKKEIEMLNEKIMDLKCQHSAEVRRREELELELSDLIQENQQLDKHLSDFAEQATEWQQRASETSCNPINTKSGRHLPISGSAEDISYSEDGSFILINNELARQTSAFSDQSEVEILSPSEQVVSPMEQNSTSFLSELGSQYHELVRKYDSLLEKCQREGIVHDIAPIPTIQRAIQTSPMDEKPVGFGTVASQKDTPATRSPGEYKKLFSQIYSKLQESKDYSAAKNNQKRK